MANNTKERILKAFDESETKTIVDVSRIVGINPTTFYFHYYKDPKFRAAVTEKQKERLEEKARSFGV